jgi:hypothetical protein
MRYAVILLLGLATLTTAAGADSAGCGVSKGLYDGWLASGKRAPAQATKADALIDSAPSVTAPEHGRRQDIGREYQAFFQCLSDSSEHENKAALLAHCKQVEGDRLALLACRTAVYLKSSRADAKEFLDSLPAGKKGAETIWDLAEIAGPAGAQSASIFLPRGPAYKLLDELFLLVLDDRDTAAAKYFNIAAFATGEGARHIDEQMKLLLREAPAVVVKKWMVLRQYQPRLKKLLADMSASLPPAEMQKMRKGLAAFCSNDNPDCPEIVKLFGKAE